MDSKELEPEAWARPLYDGFEASDFSAEGGLYYKTNLEQSAGTIEFQNQVVYRGAGALKLSVGRPRVQATEMGSERAEIWERRDLWAPYDRGIWYGFAVKFAEPIPRDDHRYVIAQWKREIAGTKGDFSPFLALRLKRGKLFATVETNLLTGTGMRLMNQTGQFEGGSAKVWLRPETNQTRAFVAADDTWKNEDGACFDTYTREITIIDRGHPLPRPGSGWIDFVIYSKPGPDGSGYIEIIANQKWIATIRGRIGHSEKGLGSCQYFKFGPYRDSHDSVWTLYYDEFRRSLNYSDVCRPAASRSSAVTEC
jgi:hypothetical protein